jgi:hypothetical protein
MLRLSFVAVALVLYRGRRIYRIHQTSLLSLIMAVWAKYSRKRNISRGKHEKSELVAQASRRRGYATSCITENIERAELRFQTLTATAIPSVKQTSSTIPESTTTHQGWRKCCKTSPQNSTLHRADLLPLETNQVHPSDFPTTQPLANGPWCVVKHQSRHRRGARDLTAELSSGNLHGYAKIF